MEMDAEDTENEIVSKPEMPGGTDPRELPPPFDADKTYLGVHARVEDGRVCEIFEQPDDGFAMEDRFHPSTVWVQIDDVSPRPASGWTAKQGAGGVWKFSPPVA